MVGLIVCIINYITRSLP